MTALRQEQRQSAPEYTAEDVERLARFMGWRKHTAADNSTDPDTYAMTWNEKRQPIALLYRPERSRTFVRWNPFLSADADLQVLERAREVWGDGPGIQWITLYTAYGRLIQRRSDAVAEGATSVWTSAPAALAQVLAGHQAGDYSRAVLEVLRSMPEEGKP